MSAQSFKGSPEGTRYRVHPVGHPLNASVVVPGSKSIANRAAICAMLADGKSVLSNVPDGDDTSAMLECISVLGAGIESRSDDSTIVAISGTGGLLCEGPLRLNARLAGTTSRFVTALCAIGTGDYEIDGQPPLRTRPMAPLHDSLLELGAEVEPADAWGHLPVRIRAIPRSGGAIRQTVTVPGDVSSQFITALMLIGPYLPGGVRIELSSPLVSRPYLAITAAVMSAFGASDVRIEEAVVTVGPGRYLACDYTIEPDASSASYPLAAAAVCGGSVTVVDLGQTSLQGDAEFATVLEKMGCGVSRTPRTTTVRRNGDLAGLSIDMAHMSDLVPTLAVVAPFATTATEITGVGFIRAKESDRIGDLARELRKCGVSAVELDDGIRIEPGFGAGTELETHDDHRLAMAFGVLGLRVPGVLVGDPGVVSKSWPRFWSMLETIGGPR